MLVELSIYSYTLFSLIVPLPHYIFGFVFSSFPLNSYRAYAFANSLVSCVDIGMLPIRNAIMCTLLHWIIYWTDLDWDYCHWLGYLDSWWFFCWTKFVQCDSDQCHSWLLRSCMSPVLKLYTRRNENDSENETANTPWS